MAITATERTEIEKLLVLMFNAAPGANYLSLVTTMFEQSGHNLQAVANGLDDLQQFQDLHPNFQTAAEFAADFLTPLGLQNDDFAKNFIIDKFNAGVPKGEIMYEALVALNGVDASYPAQYVAAKAILANKAAVSEYYSVEKGISNTDVGILQTVLSGITADPATVTTAKGEIDSGTRGVQGIEADLSPTQDTITGTNAADLVNGLFGSTDATYTAGDNIDGGAGSDRLNLVATGVAPSANVTVKNVESINIQDTVGATFNALLVQSAPAINFTNTVAGQTSKVMNAALASTIGLAGAGNLTVGYATTTGTTDTANLSFAGASAATVDISNVNSVEAVKIATTGTNVVALDAGTNAGTVTVTGDGTNTFTFTSIKNTATIDASASTGTNTFTLGTQLSNGDVIKGGTGADTASFKATAAIGVVTFTGVETLKAEFDAAALLNLGTSTGIKTITLDGSAESATITNAPSSLTAVNITSVEVAGKDLTLDYAKDQTGALTLTVGNTTSKAAAISMDDLTFGGVGSFTLNGVGTKALTFDDITLDDTTTSVTLSNSAAGTLKVSDIVAADAVKFVTLTAGAGSTLTAETATATGSSDVALSLNVGAEGLGALAQFVGTSGFFASGASAGYTSGDYLEGGVVAGSFADVTVNVGADGQGYLVAGSDDGGFGNITVTGASGAMGHVEAWANSDEGVASDIGNVTLTIASGAVFSGYESWPYYTSGVEVGTNSGDVGNVVVSIGSEAYATVSVEANGYQDEDGVYAGGGSVGDVTLTVDGENGTGYLSAYAYANVSGAESGANIGNITITAEGSGAYASGYVSADGGDVGAVTITVGADADASFSGSASDWFSGSSGNDFGNIGDIAVAVGVSGDAWVDVDSDGNIGTTTITLEDSASAGFSGYASAGDIGAITVTGGSGGHFSGYAYASAGDIGAQTVSVGDGGYAWLSNSTSGGDIGALSITGGEQTNAFVGAFASGDIGSISVDVGVNSLVGSMADFTSGSSGFTSGNGGVIAFADGSVGEISISGGDSTDFANVIVGAESIAGVNLAGWLGSYYINASSAVGTVITTGAAGGYVYATAGSDVVTGGAGVDHLFGEDGTDVLNGAAGNDIIDGGLGLDVMNGGTGDDTFIVSQVGDVAAENSAEGTDIVKSSVSFTLGANVENLTLTNGVDATDATGNALANVIIGDAAVNIISGAAGADTMAGAAGADTFVFTGTNLITPVAIASLTVTDTIALGTAVDFVTASDKLDFAVAGTVSNYQESTTAAADLPALLAAADSALDGTVQYYFGVVAGNGYLIHSTDGLTADTMIKLTGVTNIAETDIV